MYTKLKLSLFRLLPVHVEHAVYVSVLEHLLYRISGYVMLD